MGFWGMRPTFQAGAYAVLSLIFFMAILAIYLRDDHANHWLRVEERLDFLMTESIIAVDVLFQERRSLAMTAADMPGFADTASPAPCRPDTESAAALQRDQTLRDVYLGRAQLISEDPPVIVSPTYFRRADGSPARLCIDLSRILQWWASMDWPEGAAVALIRDGRELLIRLPFSAELLNRDIADGPLVTAIREAGTPSGQAVFQATNTDNVTRRVAWRGSETTNLILAAGFSVDTINARWWDESSQLFYSVFAIAGLASFCVFVLTLNRLKSREVLALSEARLKAATEAGRMGVWEFNIDTGTLIWDQAMFDLYDVDRKAFSGVYEVWRSRVHPDDLAATEAQLDATVTTGVPFDTAFRVCLPDGTVHTIKAVAKLVAGEDGLRGRVIGVNYDITHEVEIKQQLLAAKINADAANSAKSEFLAAMSHELRTPLNALSGFSEMMAGEAFGPLGHSKYVEYAEHMKASARHLASLVTNVLDLSKIEAGQLDIVSVPIDLSSVMEECTHLVAYRASRQATDVEIEISGPETLYTDKRALRQMLINLLSNADKYTPGDGRIRLSAAPTEDGGAVIKISDTGVGIAKEDLTRVLEPFGQARAGVTVTHEGTGLGLSLSDKLMRLLGGSLTLESEPGVGTTVTLRFPKHPPESGAAPEEETGGGNR